VGAAYRRQGKRCDIGLGGLKAASLAETREEARKYRAIARNDGDPLAQFPAWETDFSLGRPGEDV
jgi:Arm DNA-binding domain